MKEYGVYPSKRRVVLFAISPAGFTFGGAYMAGFFKPISESPRYSYNYLLLMGWLAIIFFLFCTIYYIGMVFNCEEHLWIGSAGIRAPAWSDQIIPWAEVEDVTTYSTKTPLGLSQSQSLVLHLRDPSRFPARGIGAVISKANRGITGGDIVIPLICSDRTVDEAMGASARHRRKSVRNREVYSLDTVR